MPRLMTMLRQAGDLDSDHGLRVNGIELLKLSVVIEHNSTSSYLLTALLSINSDRVMQIGSDALVSLGIFAEEDHPSVHSTQVKEGLSLFGLMRQTKTPMGETQLRQWFLRPTLDLDTIRQRQDTIECLLRPESSQSARSFLPA